MVINVSKTFLQTESFFIISNQKEMIFVSGGTGLTERKLINFYNVKFYISSVRLCSLVSFSRLIPTYWHEEEPSGCSVYAQPRELFKQYIYSSTYLTIMLQASWHISEGN